VLAKRFGKVIALDNSENMLQQAKAYCQGQSNIEFILSDTSYCQKQYEAFDCVVVNMVLHHVPSPGQVFADISQALRPGGTLLICDLCRHDQEWTKSSCGDLWLGFDPLDLNQWALENNFTENQTSFIALRNGFQIQLKQFTKQRSSS
jgi:ArsR family transcriptional regulator